MDIDLFLEEDIPSFLDGFEKSSTKEKVSESDIDSLLSPAEQKARDEENFTNNFDPDSILNTGKSIELKTDAVTVKVGDEEHTYAAGKKSYPDIDEKIMQRAANALPREQLQIYSEALTAIDSQDRQKAISLLSGLLRTHPQNIAYKTRLADALRLPGGAPPEDSPLPESGNLAPPAPSSSEKSQDHSMYLREHMLERYMKAVHLLRSGDKEKAKTLFASLAKENPHNLAVQLHLQELGDTYD